MDPKLILFVISIIQFSVCYPFSSDSLPCSYGDFENVTVNCKGAVFDSHICDNLKQDVNISSVSAVSFKYCEIAEYSDILNQFPKIRKLLFSRHNILPSANFSIFEHLSLFKSVDNRINTTTTSATELSFDAANLELFYFQGNFMNCNVSSISLQNATQLVLFYMENTLVAGLPSDLFMDSNNLTRIQVKKNKIEDIDSMNWPSSVRYMEFSETQINQLTKHSFKNLMNLQILELNYNKISQIEAETFSHLNNLVWLTLNDNHIKVINKNMLKGLNNLIAMNLYNNDFNYIEDGTFESTTNLSVLTMNKMDISSLNQHMFAGLNRLTFLGIEASQIRQLAAESFGNLTHIRGLQMQYGMLETVDFNAFANLPKLGQLDLSYNNISRLVKMAPTNWNVNQTANNTFLSDVTEILNGIDLKWLTPIFPKAGQLGNELMKNQFIYTADESVLKKFIFNELLSDYVDKFGKGSNYGLKSLVLTGNQLTEIEKYVFAEFKTLEKLILTLNPITTLYPESFAGLNELELLDLGGCKLISVDFSIFTHLTKLDILYLYGNQLKTITAASQSQPSIRFLLLNDNQLTAFPMKKSNFPNLKKLDISKNLLNCSNMDPAFANIASYRCIY